MDHQFSDHYSHLQYASLIKNNSPFDVSFSDVTEINQNSQSASVQVWLLGYNTDSLHDSLYIELLALI